jgi:hypothetical protein
MVVNLSECEFCVYHAKAALRQVSNRRPDVQGRTLFERQLKPVVDRGESGSLLLLLQLPTSECMQ